MNGSETSFDCGMVLRCCSVSSFDTSGDVRLGSLDDVDVEEGELPLLVISGLRMIWECADDESVAVSLGDASGVSDEDDESTVLSMRFWLAGSLVVDAGSVVVDEDVSMRLRLMSLDVCLVVVFGLPRAGV